MNHTKATSWLIFALCLAVLCISLPAAAKAESPILEVHFIDVEVNDAIFIRCGDECVFIDSGAESYGPKCVEYLRKQGVTQLKYYIGTHAHLDHVGAAKYILTAFPTRTVLANSDFTLRLIENRAKTEEERNAIANTTFRAMTLGEQISVGGAKITCLAPKYLKSITGINDTKENENSLILRVSLGAHSFILTGDAQFTTFWNVVNTMPEVFDCTVYKNAHHRGTIPALVMDVLKADYVVYQTADYCVPDPESIAPLRNMGSTVLITAANHAGNVAFYTDGKTIRCETENKLGKWSLGADELEVEIGSATELAVKGIPMNVPDTLMWSTSDASVAWPDPNTGAIYAESLGECVITARAFDGSESSIKITVTPIRIRIDHGEEEIDECTD